MNCKIFPIRLTFVLPMVEWCHSERGNKRMPIHDSYIDRKGFVHCVEKDGETGEVLSDDVESEPDPDELNEKMKEEN